MDGLANLDYVIGFAELALKGMGQAILRFERVKIEIGGNNQRQSNQVPRRDPGKGRHPLGFHVGILLSTILFAGHLLTCFALCSNEWLLMMRGNSVFRPEWLEAILTLSTT